MAWYVRCLMTGEIKIVELAARPTLGADDLLDYGGPFKTKGEVQKFEPRAYVEE